MTRIFYDTEFLEDGHTIGLISIGMIAEDGRELYLVNEAIDDDEKLNDRIRRHPWLMANVIPHLPLRENHGRPSHGAPAGGRGFFLLDRDDRRVVSRRYIRNAVRDFILATPDPQLWAWYAAYDHVVLAQLFGAMINLPAGIPMFTNDLKQECVRLGNPRLREQESGQHNALADARHNLTIAHALDALARADVQITGRPVRPTCRRCGVLFDLEDKRFDGHAEDDILGYCCGCVDNCHEGGADHRCVICEPKPAPAPTGCPRCGSPDHRLDDCPDYDPDDDYHGSYE